MAAYIYLYALNLRFKQIQQKLPTAFCYDTQRVNFLCLLFIPISTPQ